MPAAGNPLASYSNRPPTASFTAALSDDVITSETPDHTENSADVGSILVGVHGRSLKFPFY